MFEPYDNQSEIDKVQRIVENICPGLKINSFELRWNTNTVVAVGVTLAVKGNKEIIKKLMSIGFRKRFMRKQESGFMYDGYSMCIALKMPLPTPPKE